MKKNSQLGFTLTELLAVIVIIGVLLLLAVSGVSSFVGRGKVQYYQGLEKSIKIALQDYLLDYRSLLPREIGEITEITSDELINNKYIDGIVDENKEACDFNLAVEKTGKQKYEYHVCLKCGGKDENGKVMGSYYTSNARNCEQTSGGSIQVSKKYDIVVPEIVSEIKQCHPLELPGASVYQNVIGDVTERTLVTDNLLPTPRSLDTKILGRKTINYVYRHQSKNKTVTIVDEVTPTISGLKLYYVDGSEYKATNSDGSTNVANQDLTLEIVGSDLACSSDDTICLNRCPNVKGSGIKKVEYKMSTDSSWKSVSTSKNTVKIELTSTLFGTLQVQIVDNDGNVSEISEINVYMDKNKPGKTIVSYLGGSNSHSWKNNYKLKLSATDDSNVIVYYEIDYNQDGIIDSTTSSTYVPANGIDYCNVRFRAVDMAGNRGEWSDTNHIHMDTVAPSKTTVSLGSYTSDKWTNQDVIQTYSATDSLSNIDYYEYSYNKSNIIGTTDGNWTLSTDGQYTIYARAIDKAGNKGEWSDSYKIKRDTVKPTCKIGVVGSPNQVNGWYTEGVKFELKEKDDNIAATYSSYPVGASTSTPAEGKIYTGEVKDDAGNKGTCEILVKIDVDKPTADISLTGATATITLSDNIGLSGYGLNVSDSEEPSYTGISGTTSTFTYTATEVGTYYVWVKDSVGNLNTIPFEVDSSAFCSLAIGDAVTFTSNNATAPCSGYYKVVAKSGWGGFYAYEYEGDSAVEGCKPGPNLYKVPESNRAEAWLVKWAGVQKSITSTIYIDADSALVRTIGKGGQHGYCVLSSNLGNITSTRAAGNGGKSSLTVDGVKVVESAVGTAATASNGTGPCNSNGCANKALSVWAGKTSWQYDKGADGSVTVTYQGTTQ